MGNGIVYLGSGGLQGAARESALKVPRELTAGKLAAFYDPQSASATDLNRWWIMNAGGGDGVQPSYTRQYDSDSLAELRRDNQAMRVVAIAAESDAAVRSRPTHPVTVFFPHL